MRDRSWNVSAIRAGEAGIFGLSHKGVLRRFTRGKYKDVGSSDAYLSVVAVGRDVVWLLDERERLVAASATTGRAQFRSPAKVSKETWFAVDAVTDELVYATRQGFQRISAKDGAVEDVPEMPDPPRQQESDARDDE